MASSNVSLVVRVPEGQPELVKEEPPLPIPGTGQVQVKVDGAVLGCDFVGEVTKLEDTVTRLNKGDNVGKYLGWADTVNTPSQTNTFPLKVPASISQEKASTVPLAAATVWLALFSKDCLNIDRSNAKGTSVLVRGGSSIVYAIQLAMIYGLDVITTCRPHNEDLVRSCGAKYVFDYNDPNVIVKITEVALILRLDRNAKHDQASNDDHELASELFENLPSWLEQGLVKPNKAKVLGWILYPKDSRVEQDIILGS
ncbi:Polyketide synthase, enoylreductase [Penicillium expansum]|uniref:Polyketide synthase, enoylreductase n=1 Tax=Penicillium expansum TaxID=27334 RepID=A0A0A2I8G5_PENEN|nr:Polyketide synthase, enoylreductase [Penicillium expansum]KGO39412.1 Polyketide synthase, enoylreductase [Penicillium expansum]KGO47411.1 Polyketide synthase, enoylreductase [Penicillium expansum]KGO55856.1 Polyketide synthase, enoylreductase [Penicillium expansum]